MEQIKRILIGLAVAASVVGCQKDTNIITPETVEAANKHRIEVIDKDPNMTPDQKQKMKQALRLIPGGPPGASGPANRAEDGKK